MRVLLIKPYNLSDHIQPAIGLGYLATALRDKHEVMLLDCIKEGIDIAELKRRIEQLRPDVVGMQCYTFHVEFARQASEICKKINKDMFFIVGGPHPSSVPESFLEFGQSVDFGFVGEAELGLKLLLEKLNQNNGPSYQEIPGLIWRNNATLKINERYVEEDLDKLGMPAWDLIKPETYPEAQHGAFFRNFPIAPIITTRGCPYPCTFCAVGVISGKKLRKRSPSSVIKEIDFLYHQHGIREFHVVDDNFTLDTSHAKTILKGIINLNLNVSLATPNGVRLDLLDEELLYLMKKSGLYLVSLGIESGSDSILKAMKKNLTVEKTRKAVATIRKAGIEVAGFFIIGFPGETREDIKKTINFALELDLIRANFFTYLPFPGTESYKNLERSGELKKVNWDRFYFMSAPYVPKGLTHKELKMFQREAFMRFFLRPGIFYKNLLGIKSFRHLRFLLKRFYHWVIMS